MQLRISQTDKPLTTSGCVDDPRTILLSVAFKFSSQLCDFSYLFQCFIIASFSLCLFLACIQLYEVHFCLFLYFLCRFVVSLLTEFSAP